MPKSIVYKANSIIYFKGDISDKIFILNQGQVSLNSLDIETGSDVRELIKQGEFFGVKSALGRYPREETAVVMTHSKVIAFSVPEFEQLVSKNTRIIIKMLKVFSNQLRRVHKQVQNLMYVKDQENPEVGLYRIGEYYLKKKMYHQAIYAFDRYLVFYPSGKNADNAAQNIKTGEEYLQKYGQGQGPAIYIPEAIVAKPKRGAAPDLAPEAKDYYEAMSLITAENYEAGARILQTVIAKKDGDNEFVNRSKFELGKCLYYMKKHDSSIKLFTALLQQFPTHPDLVEILNFIARSNTALGEKGRAIGIYKKILSLITQANPLYQEALGAIKQLERSTE